MKDKVIVILFVGTLFLFSILGLFFEDKSLSNYERRKLVGVSKLKDDFFENLDDYLSDQFPSQIILFLLIHVILIDIY